MAVNPSMAQRKPTVSSVLRTVLLCDWADSTSLIETLGDAGAIELLQEHDEFLRNTLAITQGRLIDKADGVLALFERPIQALDFALRYQQQMRRWGKHYQQAIQARIGIHVGDVMTWQNEPDQIRAGAKPLEVEGLAKPIAARLMSLAMPGQILMSGMAQSLAQRAQLELGDRGANLRWLVHGRYQFKGVPAPMLVHEVGDPEFSPLRAPISTQKAWRDIPLWRRPPVIALEVMLSLGLLGGILYTTLQSPPAIAFYERDWVVLGDVQNRSDETLFSDSLDTTLRLGLEQSSYVNVISDSQEASALEMMQRKDAKLDRLNGTEVALRTNAKAFVLPTLSKVGGVLRVSAEVIDPNTGVTVYSESADAKHIDDVLDAADEVLENIRKRLGESLPKIKKSSKPLEQVTTKNLEALRAYSLARVAFRESRYKDARLLYEQAIKADNTFALAYIGLAVTDNVSGNSAGFKKNIALANSNRAHLTNRESLLLDATLEIADNPSESIPKWKLLGQMYPDDFRAHYQYAFFSYRQGDVDDETFRILESAIKSQNASIANVHYLKGVMLLYKNEYKLSVDAFSQAEAAGVRGYKSDFVMAHVAMGDYESAEKILKSQTKTGEANTDANNRLPEILIALSKGQYDTGLKISNDISKSFEDTDNEVFHGITLLLGSLKPTENYSTNLNNYIDLQADALSSNDIIDKEDHLFNIYAAAWMAARSKNDALAKAALTKAESYSLKFDSDVHKDMLLTAKAEILIAGDDAEDAILLLQQRAQNHNALYLLHATLERAYRQAGKTQQADAKRNWLADSRGRAYAEYNYHFFLQPLNVYMHSQLARRLND